MPWHMRQVQNLLIYGVHADRNGISSWPVVNIFNGYIWEGKPSLTDREGKDIFEGVLPEGLTKEDVMHEHRKHFPFSSSDCSQYLEIAVQRAIRSGKGTEHGGVLIDLSCMTDEYVNALKDDCGIHHMWPIARDYMKNKRCRSFKRQQRGRKLGMPTQSMVVSVLMKMLCPV